MNFLTRNRCICIYFEIINNNLLSYFNLNSLIRYDISFFHDIAWLLLNFDVLIITQFLHRSSLDNNHFYNRVSFWDLGTFVLMGNISSVCHSIQPIYWLNSFYIDNVVDDLKRNIPYHKNSLWKKLLMKRFHAYC